MLTRPREAGSGLGLCAVLGQQALALGRSEVPCFSGGQQAPEDSGKPRACWGADQGVGTSGGEAALRRELTQAFPRCPDGGEGSGRVCDPRLFGAARSRALSPWGSRGLTLAAPDNYFSSGNQ